MKVTKIRNTDNTKATERVIQCLAETILTYTEAKGFRTEVEIYSATSIKIGLHMSSFRIITSKLGHNARLGRYVDSPKGYKRTDVPTWDQRVEFNDLINSIFDNFKLKANIKSGCYTVRSFDNGAMNESDWESQTPSWMGYQGAQYNGLGELCSKIMTETDARDELDSDKREADHKAATRLDRLNKAKAARAKRKAFEACTHVIVSGLSNWPKTDKRNGKRVTKEAFYKLLSKLSSWESRRVKKESIEKTLESKKPALSLVQGGAA